MSWIFGPITVDPEFTVTGEKTLLTFEVEDNAVVRG